MSQIQVTGEAKIRDLQGPVVANSGVITALDGLPSQYVRGDGTLADIPSVTGGGASVSYYLNGSVNQGTFGGSTYYQLGESAITGVGTNFSTSTDGLLAQFITDAGVPDVTEIPSGNWNIEFYMGVSASSGALASFYVDIFKYDGTTFTLIGSNSTTPDFLTNTTTVDAYFTSVAMPLTAMAQTDRIAIRVYANVAGKTVTIYTEDNRLCQVVTTFSRGMLSLNSLTDQQQYLTVGTAGTDFNIVSAVDTHTFNIPSASATNRGLITTGTQTIAGDKTLSGNNTFSANNTFTNDILVNGLTIGKGAGTILNNTAIGITALYLNTTGSQNTALGYAALSHNTTGENNIGIGSSSLFDNTTGSGNIGIGVSSLAYNTTGYWNNAIGLNSLASNTTGYINTAFGTSALYSNTTGSGNVAVGYETLESNTTGVNNVGIGQASLFSNTNGNYNTAVGISTLQNTIGSNNTVIGHKAGELIYTGSNNTIVGVYQGTYAMSNNVILADGAGNIRYQFDGTKNIFNNLTWFENLAYGKKGYALLKGGIFTGLGILQDDTYIYSDLGDKNIVIKDVDTSFAKLQFQDTGNLTYTFPASSGTVALTSNLSAYVPYTGATGPVNLGIYGLSSNGLNIFGSSVFNANSLYQKAGLTSGGLLDYITVYHPISGNGVSYYDGTSLTSANLVFDITGNRTYTFPAASGTIALTSNLSAYLPLTGGTLTGALSGTSATFSANGDNLNLINDAGQYITINFKNAGINKAQVYFDNSTNRFYVTNSLYFASTGAATFSSSVTAGGNINSSYSTINGSAQIGVTNTATSGQYTSASFSISAYNGTSVTSGASLFQTASTFSYQQIGANQTNLYGLQSGGIRIATVSAPIIFANGSSDADFSTERMRITSSGNVGIGTSIPNLSAGATGSTIVTISASASGRNGILELNGTRTTENDIVGYVRFFNNAAATPLADIRAIRGSSDTAGSLTFDTSGTERMRITSSGQVLFGSTSTPYNNALFRSSYGTNTFFSFGPRLNDNVWVLWNDSGTGVYLTNGNSSWSSASDERLKNIDSNIDNALDSLMTLRTVKYSWKNDLTNKINLGLIAQDVYKVLPEAVDIQNDEIGTMGVRYTELVPVLIAAIQELKAEIDILKNK